MPAYWIPQDGPQMLASICPVDIIFFGGTRGGGKMLSNSSKIQTPKGWIKNGDVKIGDTITNPETGGTQKVLAVYRHGKQDIYRVEFDDGAAAHASLDHLWAYRCANRMRPNTKKSKQREYLRRQLGIDFSVKDRFSLLKVGTTEALKNELQAGGHDPRIPLTAPVLFDKNGRAGVGNSPPPYLLGLMLGDGTFSSGRSCHQMTTEDSEIIDYLLTRGFQRSGKKVSSRGIPTSYIAPRGSSISKSLSRWAANHKLLGKCGKDKFIPGYVFTANVKYRLEILRGLLDSDGFVDDRGHIEFTNISDDLAFGVQDLVRSFGGKATVSDPIVGKYRCEDGSIKECQEYRRVYIQSNYASKLFNLTRKKNRCVDRWNGGFENMRKVVSVEFSHREECTCITVSSPHGLYITDDYIVTHNSDCLIGRQIRGAELYGRWWNGLILRRKFKDFAEIRRRVQELIAEGLPATLFGGENQTNYLRFENGAMVRMTAVNRLELVDSFQGHQYCEIGIDEAPNFPFVAQMIEKLKGCLRSPHGVPCTLFLTGNPGGPGASIIKSSFIDPAPPFTVLTDDAGETSVFVQSTLDDNKILNEKDPKYVARLRSIKDPALRAAWLEGRWDVFVGQAFTFIEDYHVVEPVQVPRYAPIYMTYDWGYAAPFSVGWWWVDSDGRGYRFAEWYGCSDMPGEGLQLSDTKMATGIIEREKRLKEGLCPSLDPSRAIRLAGPDCFQKKPGSGGQGQGPPTSEVFASVGRKLDWPLIISPGDPSRPLKIRQFRERLDYDVDEETGRLIAPPMLRVYNTCRDFIRTIPAICLDDYNVEDVDTDGEDHQYDEACHFCMARPLKLKLPASAESESDKRLRELVKGKKSRYERYAKQAQARTIAAITRAHRLRGDRSGGLKNTIPGE